MSNIQNLGIQFQDATKATWEDDKLDRKRYAVQLTNLVKGINKPFVMTLSAPWGSGKTFFLNAWRNEIAWNGEENVDKIACIYFSAWEYDCVDDPLLAIVGKIQEELNKILTKEKENADPIKYEIEKEKTKKHKDMLIKLGKTARAVANKENLSKWGLKLLNKTFMKTVGENLDNFIEQADLNEYFTKEDLQELLKDIKNSLGTSPEKKLQAVLKEKEVFIETVKQIVAECREILGKDYPILIMIDELDRCRPDYVINLLERIKNLFEIEGIFFVLAIDREQLYSVVEHVFGIKKTEEKDFRAIYLQKFVNMNFDLPQANFTNYLDKFLFQYNTFINITEADLLYNFNKKKNPTTSIFIQSLQIAKIFSLRELEQKVEKLNIILNSYKLDYLEALLIWFSIIDSAPITYLNVNKYMPIEAIDGIYDENINYYKKEYNFIDNFFANFNLWSSGHTTILHNLNEGSDDAYMWSMNHFSGFCAQILRQYIDRYNLKTRKNKEEFINQMKDKFTSMLCFSSGFIAN